MKAFLGSRWVRKLRFGVGPIVLSLAATTAQAANLLVYNTNDSGAGSLRQAIANNATMGGGNTIIFSNVVTGTITLTTDTLWISNNVTILGPGPNVLAVDGSASYTVFRLSGNQTVSLTGLTVTNGGASGIINYGSLTVSNCTIINCVASSSIIGSLAGGIGNNGALTVIASTIANNSGGGIYNILGTVALLDSSLTGNSGGALFNNGGGVTVTASTISGNSGGGISNFGSGSFFGNPVTATLTISASTFSGNSGGGIGNGALAGGVATVQISDTILKAGASGANIGNNGGTITSQGYNLSSDNGGGFLTATGDQINTDPMLGSLADNGGPTPTIALKAGSPAIDKGKSFGITTDQRGQLRYDNPNIVNATGGDGADIGAYEAAELRIVNAQKTGNHLRLDFLSWLGTNYEVQSRADMVTGNWASLPGSTPGNGGIASTTVSNAFNQSQQFYRIHPAP